MRYYHNNKMSFLSPTHSNLIKLISPQNHCASHKLKPSASIISYQISIGESESFESAFYDCAVNVDVPSIDFLSAISTISLLFLCS